MLLVASTDVMLLRIVQPLLNNIGTVDADAMWWLPFAIVGVFLLRGVGSYVSEYGLAWIGSRVVYDLRVEACDHLLRLPTPYYDATSAGFLLSRITFDAQQIAATASEAITVSVRNSLTIAFMLGYLLYLNWQLTLIAFAAMPFIAFALRKIRRRMKRVSTMVQDRTGALTHALEEAIGAHRIVKVFGGEKYEAAGFAQPRTSCGFRWRSRRPRRRSARRSTRSSFRSRSAPSCGPPSGRAPADTTAPATSSRISPRSCTSRIS
jgi:subfamily B ATP-binding cassette protein MsbA